MEAAHLVGVGELDHVPGAVDVRPLGGLFVGLHVIDRGKVEQMVDRLVEAVDAQPLFRQVTAHRHDAALGSAQALHQRVELAP